MNRPLVSRLAAHEPVPGPRTHAFSVGEPRNYAATQSSTGIPGDRNVGVIFLLWMRDRPRPLVYQGQQFYLKLCPTWLKSQDHSPRSLLIYSVHLQLVSGTKERNQHGTIFVPLKDGFQAEPCEFTFRPSLKRISNSLFYGFLVFRVMTPKFVSTLESVMKHECTSSYLVFGKNFKTADWQRCGDADYHVRIFIIETSINGVDRSTKNLIVILKLDNRNWKVKETTKDLFESFIFV